MVGRDGQAISAAVVGGWIEDHSSARRNYVAFSGGDIERSRARRGGTAFVGADVVAQQGREIARSFGRSGNGGSDRGGSAPPRALVVGEEEHLVLDDGAAHRRAELIPAEGQQGLGRPIFGVEEIVAQIFESRPVQRIGSGFCSGLHERAGDGAKLRIVVAGGDLKFLQRVDVRIDDSNSEDRAIVLSAIEEKSVRSELLAVRVDLIAGLGIF